MSFVALQMAGPEKREKSERKKRDGIIMLKKFAADLRREFAGYSAARLMKDLMAGITVAAVALPLALAFGVSSGATAAAGLVTAILAGVVISLLSGASFQVSGPTGAMSAVLITIVSQYSLQGVFFACFAAGAILLICGILKLGRLIGFIPLAVVMGFTSGIAITIASGQVANFFGMTLSGSSLVDVVRSLAAQGFHPQLHATLIGLLVIAIMVFWPKRLGARVPASLIGIIIATLLTVLLGWDDLATVGEIPKSLLLADRLSLKRVSFEMVRDLASPIITIAALAMIESLLCGASASKMKDEPFDANRELIAQGVGNMLIPLFGGVPATAAIARTSVAIKSGCQTRLTGVFHALFLLLSMFLLGGVMARLPLSGLAGVLMVTAFRMNDWGYIRFIFQHKFRSAISQFLITMVVTVIFDLTVAIVVGVLYSAILYMAASSHLDVAFSKLDEKRLEGLDAESEHYSDTVVTYVTGALFFGAVDTFTERCRMLPDCNQIIISMRGVPHIDVSGAQAMVEFCHQLQMQGVEIAFCGVHDQVHAYLTRAGLSEIVPEERFYWSADQAITDLV